MNLYRKLYFNSEEICHVNNIQKYQIQPKITFVQAETKDCNQFTSVVDKKIYYNFINENSYPPEFNSEDMLLLCENQLFLNQLIFLILN